MQWLYLIAVSWKGKPRHIVKRKVRLFAVSVAIGIFRWYRYWEWFRCEMSMKTVAVSILLILACFFLCPSTKAADTDTEIPFTLEKGHIIVAAKIKGNVPVEMALATGAEHSSINEALLQKYKLQASYTGEGVITGSSLDRVIYFVTVPDIRVGEVKVTSLYMRFGFATAGQISQRIGREVFGVLGSDFFKGRVVQFDFQKRIVRFLNRASDNATKANPNSVSLRMSAGDEHTRVPVTEEVAVNGKKLKTLFDTGALTVISLTPSASKQVGLTPPPEKAPPAPDKISSFRVGAIELTDLPVTLHAKGGDFDRKAEGYAAVVGVALLQNFLVTFDFKQGLIALERQ